MNDALPSDEDLREEALNHALAEYFRLLDEGAGLDLDEFLARNSELADELRQLINTASTVESLALDSRDTLEHETLKPTSRPATDPIPDVVRLFGEYELLDELGRGGMGIVFKARQKSVKRLVALKMIIGGKYPSESSVRRFYREAAAAGKLSHRNIVRVYLAGVHDGRHYLAMELVNGMSLREILKQLDGRLPATIVANHMKSLADAVHYAHENGVLHRDLKPSNIMVDEDEVAKITDFGLAKHVDEDSSFESSSGAVIGTPSYMSPEQAASQSEEVGRGTDVYSLGAILYELLTGQPPFRDSTPVGTLLLVINQDVRPPSDLDPTCDRNLEAICLKCLEKDPEDRYQSCAELVDEFDRVLRGDPVLARKLTPIQRLRYWARGLPLVAYATGRHPGLATTKHRVVQWGVIVMLLLGVVGCLNLPMLQEWRYTYWGRVQIGVAGDGGYYDTIGRMIADEYPRYRATLVTTQGSIEILDDLPTYEIDVGIAQSNALTSMRFGRDWEVLAPLYDEAVLIIVRRDLGIQSLSDLQGRRIGFGSQAEGSRTTANQLLKYNEGLTTDVAARDLSWRDLRTTPSLDGAIATIGLDAPGLRRLMDSGEFAIVRLEPKDLPSDHFSFREFSTHELPDWMPSSEDGVILPTTVAMLVVRPTATSGFVRELLEKIYFATNEELTAKVFPMQDATNWIQRLHPAATKYFRDHLGNAN